MMRFSIAAVCIALGACSPSPQPAATTMEEPAERRAWQHGAIVSAANPKAVAAAIAVLEQGGHAVDAAIAAHAVLGLVEPESSGIGGSGFMIVYDRSSDTTRVFDGRETAPSGATPEMYTVNGTPIGGREKWNVGVSVGVPGAVALYEAAHAAYGQLEWSSLFSSAIGLASDGFEVTEKFVRYNAALEPALATGAFPDASDYLFPGGEPHASGSRLKNPAYAATLKEIASAGAQSFYSGEIAAAMVARAQAAPLGSSMTLEDLAAYEVVEREPICGSFRRNRICSVPPPSSGVTHIMIPALYDELLTGDEQSLGDKIAVFVDAQRLAYADRDHFIGDPGFVDVPADQLIEPAYLEHRATDRFAPSETPVHGDLFFAESEAEAAYNWGSDTTFEAVGTSHLAVIDSDGNAVSMTMSVGYPWGSIRMTNGFFLNNELTDFSSASPDGLPVPNSIEPGKRPRSSMSPTIVFDSNGDPLLLTGSAGGSSIIAYTTKTIIGILDWGLTPPEATDFPNIVARGDSVGVEVSAEGGQAIADDLIERGYNVQAGRGENSGLHVLFVTADGLSGAADSRRHGTVGSIPPTATAEREHDAAQ